MKTQPLREHVTKRLANFDLLSGLDCKPEPAWRLKDHDDRASELEATHLLSARERLAAEERGSLAIVRFYECARRRSASEVSAEVLWGHLVA